MNNLDQNGLKDPDFASPIEKIDHAKMRYPQNNFKRLILSWVMINASSNTDIFPLSSIKVNDIKDDAISLHRILKGKIEIKSKVFTDDALDGKNDTISLIYTPGVAYVAQEISGTNP